MGLLVREEGKEGVDEWDKSTSFIAGAIPHRNSGGLLVTFRTAVEGWIVTRCPGRRGSVPGGCGQTFLRFRFPASRRKPVVCRSMANPARRMRRAPGLHALDSKQTIHFMYAAAPLYD
jgi:hypothetical protein